jgi:hypothetical protein
MKLVGMVKSFLSSHMKIQVLMQLMCLALPKAWSRYIIYIITWDDHNYLTKNSRKKSISGATFVAYLVFVGP